MERCIRCIMPDTAKGIKFNKAGVCQLCENHKRFVPKGLQQLLEEVQLHKSENREHNCVVPVSGGRDSSYALYYAKMVLGLKPIAVHNDNDFITGIANRNLESITKSINVPLIRISSKKNISKKIVVEKFKMNAFFGPWLVVDETCEACEYGFYSAAYNIARREDIKLVIWGDSKDESSLSFHSLFVHQNKPSKWDRLLKPGIFSLIKYKMYFNRMKREYGPNTPNGLKEIHLYDYIEWDRKIIVDTIQQKLGWSAPADSPTTWRIDCSLVPLVNYLTERAYGVNKLEIGFSNMIRNGKMERNEALRQIQHVKQNVDIEKLRVLLMDMGIDQATINNVL